MPARNFLDSIRSRFLKRKPDNFPLIIHATHAKAGSTWINAIFRDLFGKRVAPRSYSTPDFANPTGRIHTVFMTREELESLPGTENARPFVVIRSLRDTLVSLYFSLRYSHELDPDGIIAQKRERLAGMQVEDGLDWLLDDTGFRRCAEIQRSWSKSGRPIITYEQLLKDAPGILPKLILEDLGLPAKASEVREVISRHRFEVQYGRERGKEDIHSHGRKGISGDWKNYFTPALSEKFSATYGDLSEFEDQG